MVEWLSSHHEIISLFINLLMLLVWLFYAHLLLNNYRRQRRPKLLINQGVRGGIDSRCMICNMSEEAIYVALMIAELHTSEGRWECEVTDFVPHDDPGRSLFDQTTQGPLKAGQFRDVESFRTMVDRVLRSQGQPELADKAQLSVELQCISIHVIGVYVSEDEPVGASRHFDMVEDGDSYRLSPTEVDTERLSSRKQRQRVAQWLRRYL